MIKKDAGNRERVALYSGKATCSSIRPISVSFQWTVSKPFAPAWLVNAALNVTKLTFWVTSTGIDIQAGALSGGGGAAAGD